jgi:hypothetical protein
MQRNLGPGGRQHIGSTRFIILSGTTAPGGGGFSDSPLDGSPFEGNRLVKLGVKL